MDKNRQSYEKLIAQLPLWANSAEIEEVLHSYQELNTPMALVAQGMENLRDNPDWDGAKSLLSDALQIVKVLGSLEEKGTLKKESADVLSEIVGELLLKQYKIAFFQQSSSIYRELKNPEEELKTITQEVNMNELRIRCQHPESINRFFKDMLEKEFSLLSNSIQRIENRLSEFEAKYQLSTEEFLQRYQNDEFEETLELDEWIGESLMLKRLREKQEIYGGVYFVN